MACCTGCDGDKEVKSCPACGKPVPPSLGYKPRTYCSRECCRASSRPRKPTSSPCVECGADVPQAAAGRTKKYCSQACDNKADRRRRPKKPRQRKVRQTRPCEECGKEFLPRRRSHVFCSNKCRACRPARPAAVYKCLNCEAEFSKKRYKSGAYSCQTKYCCRECAFEARRLKLPAAINNRRKGGLTSKMASWFLSWGDDQWPATYGCVDCGAAITQRNRHCGRPEKCLACQRKRHCKLCGVAVGRPDHFCSDCKAVRKRAARKEKRRRDRAAGKRLCNHRQRCRKYGVPYKPITNATILNRDGWECQLCGVKLLKRYTVVSGVVDPRSPTVDHVIPVSLGPEVSPGHVEHNLQAACWGCNTKKSNQHPDSFAASLATSRY